MNAGELSFERRDYPLSMDYCFNREAKGKIGSDELLGIGLTGFEGGKRLYSISFDIPDALSLYDDFIDVASEDELREEDQVVLGYLNEENERNWVTLDLDDELPEDISQIDEMHVGKFAGSYRPGMNGEAAGPNSNLFTFAYDSDSDQVYQSLEEYVEELHPDERISGNASDVVSQVRNEMREFEREITESF